jgi:hypothetical protein
MLLLSFVGDLRLLLLPAFLGLFFLFTSGLTSRLARTLARFALLALLLYSGLLGLRRLSLLTLRCGGTILARRGLFAGRLLA